MIYFVILDTDVNFEISCLIAVDRRADSFLLPGFF